MRTRTPTNYSDTKIYLITNIINGKVYVGQTTGEIKRRFQSHCLKNSGCTFLHNAICKYGKNSFIIRQIDHAHTKEEADEKEKYYIKMYDSTNHAKGYNITEGGNSVPFKNTKKTICIETGEIFDSASSAGRKYNASISTLIGVCRGRKKTCNGYHWAYLDENDNPIIEHLDLTTLPRKRGVRCVETGEEYNCIVDACKDKQCSPSQLGLVVKGKRSMKTAGGYHWEYVDKRYNPKVIEHFDADLHKNPQKVICIETGKVFDSISEVAKFMGVYRSSIYDSLRYGHKCRGLHFKLIERN